MISKHIAVLVLFIFTLSVVAAQGLEPPHQFIGDVKINGADAPIGTTITAKVNGGTYGTGVISTAGKYGNAPNVFYVEEAVGQTFDGDTVELYVNGVLAATSSFTNGATTNLDLSVSIATTTTSSGSGSGGGGGGGGGGFAGLFAGSDEENDGTSTTSNDGGNSGGQPESNSEDSQEVDVAANSCTPEWICSEYTECVNGFAHRACVDVNRCGDDSTKPQIDLVCEDAPTGFGAITAAVIGGGAGSLVAVLFLVIILGGAGAFIAYRRKR